MRHNKSGRKLGRNSGHRNAMMRNMVTSLIEHGRITTTDSRAKELRKLVERMITLGKRGDLHARRQASEVIRTKEVLGKLFEQIGPRYKERPGGYTRIIKLGNRLGDNASQSIIELVEEEFTAKPKKAAPAPKAEVKTAVAAPAAAPVEATADVEETAAEAPTEEKPEV